MLFDHSMAALFWMSMKLSCKENTELVDGSGGGKMERKWYHFFFYKCVKLLPANVFTELKNTELLVDRKTGCDVRYNMVCMGIIFIVLLLFMSKQFDPELGK